MSVNKNWIHQHINDFYVKESQRQGYRSRAAYKLLEIAQKDHLFRPGITVVDLGAVPGSWSQVAVEKIGKQGQVFAIDLLPLDPIHGVKFIQGDFLDEAVVKAITDSLLGKKVDLVISDLAPNLSGNKMVDQTRVMLLAEAALAFSCQHLNPGGDFLVKVFQGSEFQSYVAHLRRYFTQTFTRKPKASRDRSSEIYLLGKGLRSGIDINID